MQPDIIRKVEPKAPIADLIAISQIDAALTTTRA